MCCETQQVYIPVLPVTAFFTLHEVSTGLLGEIMGPSWAALHQNKQLARSKCSFSLQPFTLHPSPRSVEPEQGRAWTQDSSVGSCCQCGPVGAMQCFWQCYKVKEE